MGRLRIIKSAAAALWDFLVVLLPNIGDMAILFMGSVAVATMTVMLSEQALAAVSWEPRTTHLAYFSITFNEEVGLIAYITQLVVVIGGLIVSWTRIDKANAVNWAKIDARMEITERWVRQNDDTKGDLELLEQKLEAHNEWAKERGDEFDSMRQRLTTHLAASEHIEGDVDKLRAASHLHANEIQRLEGKIELVRELQKDGNGR